MSGSGRSTAINALEDEGYYCIDNLPTALIPGFVALCAEGGDEMTKVALGLDLRDFSYVESWPSVRKDVEKLGHKVTVVFVDAIDGILLRRYSETRRAHPLGQGRGLTEAIETERELLAPLKEKAQFVVDTSSMTVHDLKRRIGDLISGRADATTMSITIKSFGYKYGSAVDADLLFDVRFLPNPHFVEPLKPLTGLDRDVADYVLDRQETNDFLLHVCGLLRFVLPRYAHEGRSYLTIGIGCTGGRHRSVAIAEHLSRVLQTDDFAVIVRHRDIER